MNHIRSPPALQWWGLPGGTETSRERARVRLQVEKPGASGSAAKDSTPGVDTLLQAISLPESSPSSPWCCSQSHLEAQQLLLGVLCALVFVMTPTVPLLLILTSYLNMRVHTYKLTCFHTYLIYFPTQQRRSVPPPSSCHRSNATHHPSGEAPASPRQLSS